MLGAAKLNNFPKSPISKYTEKLSRGFSHKTISNFLKRLFLSPEKTFVVVASIFGLILIIITPPFTGPDEEAHFVRAYGISEGSLILSSSNEVKMPSAYKETLGCMQVKEAVPGSTYTYTYEKYGQQKKRTISCALSLEPTSQKELVATSAANYSPATYIPQVLTILIGKLLNAPIVITSYLVRVSILATYIILIVAAIRILPIRKWSLVGIALLPHSIIQITNPGGDYMLLGATAIFIAAIIRSISLGTGKLTKHSKNLLLITTIAGIFMVLPKGVFPGVCFLPLLFFFGGIKKYLPLKCFMFIVILMLGVSWQKIAFSAVVSAPADSMAAAANFPHAFIKTMFYEWMNTDFIYKYMGLGFGNPIGMPAIMVTVMNMLLAMYLFVEYSKKSIILRSVPAVERWLLVVGSIVIASTVVVGSFAAMYIGQYGSDTISGVQARYFYPALLLLAVIPYKRGFTTSQGLYRTIVIIGSIVLLLTQAVAVAIRYNFI